MRLLAAAGAVVVAALIVVHGVVPEHFLVDSTTVALLVVLAIVFSLPYMPTVRKYISELSVMGTTIKFREELQRAEELAEAVATEAAEKGSPSEHKLERADESSQREYAPTDWTRFISIGEHLYRLIEEDPKLAVAGLGIEIERILREAIERLDPLEKDRRSLPLPRAVKFLEDRGLITRQQKELLMQLVGLRNLAVHGKQISRAEAHMFFSIVEQLNDSVPLGYSINFASNKDWEEQGLACAYEHCIERMALKPENWEGSCPLFGHDCPGGVSQVEACKAEEG